MTRSRSALFVVVVLLVAGATVWARQAPVPNVPGMPTPAHVTVVNAGSEPVPVVLTAAGGAQPVTLVGRAEVTMAAGTALETWTGRQPWEYRTVDLPADGDVAAALNEPGQEGWEAFGVVPAGGGASRILLKRPR